MSTAVKGPWFDVPGGTRETTCRSCDAPVFWITTVKGSRMPVDCDGGYSPTHASAGHGVSHYATCPDADKWRKG